MGKEINNQGGKIFIEEIIIDWYDGPVVALAASYEVQVFEQIKDLVDNDQAKESRYSFLHFAFQSHRLGRIFLHGISIPCEKLKCALLLLRVYSKLAGQPANHGIYP